MTPENLINKMRPTLSKEMDTARSELQAIYSLLVKKEKSEDPKIILEALALENKRDRISLELDTLIEEHDDLTTRARNFIHALEEHNDCETIARPIKTLHKAIMKAKEEGYIHAEHIGHIAGSDLARFEKVADNFKALCKKEPELAKVAGCKS